MSLESLPEKSSWRGRLYGFAFYTDLTKWLGVRRSIWVRLTAVGAFVLTLLLRLPWVVIVVVGLVMLLILAVYIIARRSGYVAFEALRTAVSPEPTTILNEEEKVAVRATGLFSIMEKERYLLQKKADYWHFPLTQHVIMVEEAPGKYLYQFVNASNIIHVKAGYLYLGEQSFAGLEIHYRTDWAPSLVSSSTNYFVGGGVPDEHLPKRTIYLTFNNREDWQRVWHSFVQ